MSDQNDINFIDDAEGVERLLSIVVKSRKTIPSKCMELDKQTISNELLQLGNAKVELEENENTEKFRNLITQLLKLRPVNVCLDDLHEAEKKIKNLDKRNKEIRNYLESRVN